jgi:hypothetical protein
MVERFNGRIDEVLQKPLLRFHRGLESRPAPLCRALQPYILQRTLGHLIPIQALKHWQTSSFPSLP